MIGFDAEAVHKEFGLAEHEIPVMLLTVGPERPGNWPQKPRLPVADVLHFVYSPRHARDEVVSDTFLELMERRVDRAGVPACIKAMVTAYNRDNPLKTYGDIRTPLPLDAPAYLDGTMSRVEIVSESLWS